jgi:hypothetical protein
LKFKADLFAWSSFLFFIIALLLPFEKDTHDVTYTFQKFLTGWYFSLTFQTFVWLAFPLLGTAWACHVEGSPKAGFVLSSSGLLLALPFMYGPELSYGWIDSMKTLQQTPQAGYYLLLLCLLLQIFASIYSRLVELERLAEIQAQVPSGKVQKTRGGLNHSTSSWWLSSLIGIAVIACIPTLLEIAFRLATGRSVISRSVQAVKPPQQSPKPQQRSDNADPRGRNMSRQLNKLLNDVPHGPPGALPPGLRLSTNDHELIVTNTTNQALLIRIWHTRNIQGRHLSVCYLQNATANNSNNNIAANKTTVSIAPGESTTFSDASPSSECNQSGLRKAKFEFIVLSAEAKHHPYVFLSDTVFEPSPPPRAQKISSFWLSGGLESKIPPEDQMRLQ